MRIMNAKDDVEEFVGISGTPCYKSVDSDIPCDYFVSLRAFTAEKLEFEYIGKYKLDGTRETYEAAMENFEKICEHALTKGYIRESEFKNFEWF